VRASKTSAGGFIWVFADEGVKRVDTNGFIDVKGNQAPDGILGPYREKEGSFFTIKEVYSPVQLPRVLPADFDGTLAVENRYEFINLSKCSFTWALRRFEPLPGSGAPAPGSLVIANGTIPVPMSLLANPARIKVALPADWKTSNADALEVKALIPPDANCGPGSGRCSPTRSPRPKGRELDQRHKLRRHGGVLGDAHTKLFVAAGHARFDRG